MSSSAPGVVRPIGVTRRARYELREQIAKGGMGVVHRAHDALLGRDVAYKRLHVADEALRPRLTALFQREYDTLARLAHPRIIEVFEYGIDAQGPFYTMELLEGEDLARRAPLSVPDACLVLRDVASALALLHARRLLHRDVSATNVRLGPDGRAKLIDFGVLASFGRADDVVGTPAFIAPECLEEEDLDARADLFSLGVLAYWVLVKRRPYAARRVVELRDAWTVPVIPPSRHVPGIPRELDELVLSMIQLDRDGRPAGAAEVMDRLTVIGRLAPEEEDHKVALAYFAHPPLVGRSDVLARIDARRREALEGKSGVFVLEAAPGMGRTAVLEDVAMRTQLEGRTLLRVQGGTHGGTFGLASALTRLALASHPQLEASLHEMGPAALALARASSGAEGESTRTPAEVAERQARLLSSIPDFLLELSDLNPLVVMIDDVHRADPESVGLLAAMAHEAEGRRLFLLVSGVLGAAPSGETAYAKLVAGAEHAVLAPLGAADTEELVAAVFGGVPNCHRLGRFLHAESGGVPLRCMNLARLLLARGAIRYTSGTFLLPHDVDPDLVPRDLDDALVARTADLGPVAVALAELLAIEDEALTLADLVAVSGREPREVLAALEGLVRYGIVARIGDRFGFLHASLAASVARTIAPERRRVLHTRAGRAILASASPTADLLVRAGFHLVRGGEERRGAEILAGLGTELAYKADSMAKAVPALEAALGVFERSGRTDVQCIGLLAPICVAGYYGDPSLYARYLRRTFRVLLYVSGTDLASRLARFVGRPLALGVGLAFAFFRHFVTPRAERLRHFRDVVQGLFGIAAAGSAAATTAYDPATVFEIVDALAPFSVLGRKHPANIARELCRAMGELVSEERAKALVRLEQLSELLSARGGVRGLDDDIRRQMLSGVIYCRSITEALLAAPRTLARAAALEREGLAFYRPHAEMLREYYYALRGEQALAEPHRVRAEVLALRGGSSWSAATVQAVRSISIFEWTRDSMGLLRVIGELERVSTTLPTLLPYRRFAEAYLEVLRGRADAAVAIYESVFAEPRRYPLATHVSERGRYAEALNAVGRHARAREVCEEVLGGLSEGERRLAFSAQWPVHQLALAEAALGDFGKATRRLDALLEEVLPSGNPLLVGSVHRDRAHVALLERDHDGYVTHARAMDEWFRATRHPSLVQQCEKLVAAAAAAGVDVPPLPERLDSEPPDGPSATTAVTSVARRRGRR